MALFVTIQLLCLTAMVAIAIAGFAFFLLGLRQSKTASKPVRRTQRAAAEHQPSR
jgi:hypothetical protein